MTADEWTTSDDWQAMLGQLPGINGSRRLRLWAVAGCRHIMERHAAEPINPENYGDWFDRLAVSVAERLDAAELFADGRISRPKLAATQLGSGGPFNVFNTPLWHTRLTAVEVGDAFADCRDEFSVPTDPAMVGFLRDIFGNPFRPVTFDPSWRSEPAVALAHTAYDTRNFTLLPILADALEEAGCDHPDVLTHCRGDGPHVRGCWVLDGVLGRV
jgi:hypothetical protein